MIDRKPSRYAKDMWWEFLHEKGLCGLCGNPTRSEEAGHMRRCTDPACNT